MKIKPLVCERIQTTHTSFTVDLQFDYNITFINGDSGTGKSALYSFLEELAAEEKYIKCFNYLDKTKNYKNSIKKTRSKLFVIDNADILLDDGMREYIAADDKNQYVIIGRNPTGLLLQLDEIFELFCEKKGDITLMSLKKSF